MNEFDLKKKSLDTPNVELIVWTLKPLARLVERKDQDILRDLLSDYRVLVILPDMKMGHMY